MRTELISLPWALLLALLVGCDEDKRLVELARESAARQAAQNHEMARVNQELARSRTDQVRLQQDLQKQQTRINSQRDKLETERRDIAQERRREAILAVVLEHAGLIIACAAPLALAGYALSKLSRNTGEDLSDFLVGELTSSDPIVALPADRPVQALARSGPPT